MRKRLVRTAVVVAIALGGVVGSGWLAMGQLGPAATTGSGTAGAASQGVPLKPSYLVTVRKPTPEEQAQRDALAKAKPLDQVINLTPDTPEDAMAEAPASGPIATVLSDVNVRSGPSRDTKAISVANAGTKLTVLGKQGSWTEVALPDGGRGWIASRFLAQ